MAKKTPPYLKEPPPKEARVTTDLSFEQVMQLAATTPKHVVDRSINEAKKSKNKKA